MSERKGINKYYPPDWDPSKVPKKKKPANQVTKVRLMAPYSMRCTKCNEYISERRKFNAKKEVTNEKYMSFKIIRFHITCPKCNNNITYKTSPQTAGYVPDTGAVRNYEPESNTNVNKTKVETEEEILERLEKEEKENKSFQLLKEKRKKNPFWQQNESLKDQKGDLMENLEKRLQDQQRQQEMTEHLEYLQAKSSSLQAKGGRDRALNEAKDKLGEEIESMKSLREDLASKEDEELTKDKFKKFRSNDSIDSNSSNKPVAIEDPSSLKRSYENALQDNQTNSTTKKQSKTIVLKKKQPLTNPKSDVPSMESRSNNIESLSGALGDYSSSDEE
ncbi:DEHA2G03696p [Debaryomyces hansenii CBS767]|uniref:Splicing factor YJU2 n=1 Tax=Debaryomyces hansenii (strain ATCC 36239 / CBS 767 / BCRC 21394 / JCM 1990 / NBRC 0083 / IGC 2968) TaxID=284592 RepID=Q6BJB5_DEBHA|nr:DEHA2G03696p [Debaryomyces hansenii CBS767]CAG90158.2 DEHA2G03696p [Debaryomyces hansenii CBS767]|eukprot:XP_461706.2 DEHA2G03696p [Debaryomyces hansenii CBS767]